jgi:hypothetical protein
VTEQVIPTYLFKGVNLSGTASVYLVLVCNVRINRKFEKNCIMRSFITCIFREIFRSWNGKIKEDEMDRACNMRGDR